MRPKKRFLQGRALTEQLPAMLGYGSRPAANVEVRNARLLVALVRKEADLQETLSGESDFLR